MSDDITALLLMHIVELKKGK